MNTTVVTYLVYLFISIWLTVWIARTLFKNGTRLLVDAFDGDAELADSVNHLLVVGFYLINLGYIALNLKVKTLIVNAQISIEVLSKQLGWVLLILGVMHFFNIHIFNKLRRRNSFMNIPVSEQPRQRRGQK